MYNIITEQYKFTSERGDRVANEDNHDQDKPIRKQKAGLGGIRPDDYVENRFKEMASERGCSQTEMFESIFWAYLRKEREDQKNNAIDYSSEINLIANGLNNILTHFKSITDKAQETIINISSSAEQKEKNFLLEIETLNGKIEELRNRNKELENNNNIFTDVKNDLEGKIVDNKLLLEGREKEVYDLKSSIAEKDIHIKNLEDSIKLMKKENASLQKDNDSLCEDINIKESKIKNLETVNVSLQSTVSNIDTLKKSELSAMEAQYKSEISAIESQYKSVVINLENKINTFDDDKKKEIKNLEKLIRTELEAEKKMAVADIKLELAEMKSKYAELKSKE